MTPFTEIQFTEGIVHECCKNEMMCAGVKYKEAHGMVDCN
jgi:hypothetical protein